MSAGRQDVYLPRGPMTLTSSGARPALLLSTVKDCKTRARTPEPSPGPAILTLLGSTTSFTGTLKGLPRKRGHRILSTAPPSAWRPSLCAPRIAPLLYPGPHLHQPQSVSPALLCCAPKCTYCVQTWRQVLGPECLTALQEPHAGEG